MEFKAIAYSDEWEDGRLSGSLTLTATTMTFTSLPFTITLYKQDVHMDHGGTGNRQIFIKSKSNKYSFSTSDKSILAHPFFENNQYLETQKKKAASSFRSTKIFLLSGLGILMIVLGILITFRSDIVRRLASSVPYSVEKTLGQSYLAQISIMGDIDSTSQEVKVLREKVGLITQNIDENFNFKVYISQDTTVNAFALPGGIMVFNKGLLQKAASWEEVLGVAAHEAAHVTEKHHARGIFSRFGIWTIISMAIGDGSFLTDIITGVGSNLEGLTYSRDYETESDVKGVEYLQLAGVNPSGLRTFFGKLSEEHSDQITSAIPEFMSTHPSHENRIEKIQALESLGKKQEYITLPDYSLFKNLFNDENKECKIINTEDK